ncbi:MAG: hypothetical protein OEZ65_12215 [Gemmatimonadota bacterium]|nr:hypothetical protein [Gemmatimonadota bacterium]MDH5760345.1 hypothetical protein [Gemmatimonadota bacterium]
MNFATRVYLIAGVYGTVVVAPLYFLESTINRGFPPPVSHPEYFYGFVGVALCWQVLFLVLARDPIRYRPMMIPAVLEKLSFGGASLVLFLQGRLASVQLGPAFIDLVFAVLFGMAYRSTGSVAATTDGNARGGA